MDGYFTKEGITRDLEAMRRVGIGEAYIGVITGQVGTPFGAGLKALTDEWWGFVEQASAATGSPTGFPKNRDGKLFLSLFLA